MLSPNYLSNVTYDIEQLFELLETDILSDVVRRIKENGVEITSTANHQLNRLNALGVQYEDVQKKMTKALNATEEKIAQVISESSYKSVDEDNKIFKEAFDKGFIPKFDYKKENLKDTILNGINSTNKELRNICNSMASASNKVYGDALDMAYLSIKSGAFSQADAVKSAVKKIAKDGISWIEFESGAHRRPDSAIRNAVRTGVNQTANRCQDKNFDDMGGNLVETSSHMGARPDHATWQGKVFWRKKRYKNYSNFELSTGYGSGAGLGGWGCRHSFFPYFEGISSKSFEHYRSDENKERYILEQEQRYNERQIREWKRREAVNKAGGVDNSKELRKVREWKKRQSDFLDAHPDMKRNYARESVVDKRDFIPQFKAVDVTNSKSFKKYSSKDINEFLKSNETTLDSYLSSIKTKWSGSIIYDDNDDSKVRFGKLWSCDIRTAHTTSQHILLHEQLHARSISYFDPDTYIKYKKIEESSVQFLTQEISNKMGIEVIKGGYEDLTDALRQINAISKLNDSDLEFALNLFKQKVPARLNWLEDQIYDKMIKEGDTSKMEKLTSLMECLY